MKALVSSESRQNPVLQS